MGMTRSFVFLKNRGDSPAVLREKLCSFTQGKEAGVNLKAEFFRGLLKAMTGEPPQKEGKVIQFPGAQPDWIDQLADELGSIPEYHVIAYCPDVPWLPYFSTELCDGNITNSRNLVKTAQLFETSVLSFAVFDSDVLYVSYYDADSKRHYDYVKPNFEGFLEEFEDDTYQEGFPEFLLDLCGGNNADRLREVWEERDVVFAEDRMAGIVELLGTQPLYDETLEGTQGFEKLSAE